MRTSFPSGASSKSYFPAAGTKLAGHAVCLYTYTPSGDFLIDRLPERAHVTVAGGFSGHGFKFAPAVGRLVADLVLDDAEPRPEFSFARFRS